MPPYRSRKVLIQDDFKLRSGASLLLSSHICSGWSNEDICFNLNSFSPFQDYKYYLPLQGVARLRVIDHSTRCIGSKRFSCWVSSATACVGWNVSAARCSYAWLCVVEGGISAHILPPDLSLSMNNVQSDSSS